MRIILSILLLSVCYSLNQINTQYLIICPERFKSAAQSLADMHTFEVNIEYQLNTEVIITNDINPNIDGIEIRNYILGRIEDDLLDNNLDLKFLLLFGDEFDIPPIFEGEYDPYPSDDFYSTVDLYNGDPQLISGRIPVSTEEDAWSVVEKNRKYTLDPTPGIWRSKVALVADDMNRSCIYRSGDDYHTRLSDELYNSLKTLVPVQPFYGVHYELQECEYPDLTGDLIRTINNGVALINYIGHGTPETWSEEKILTKSRDLSLIQVNDGKLAIWVVGTCSFGKYHGENSFMEELLIKENGAIALMAATDDIGYNENRNYLYNLFGLNDTLGIQHIVRNGYNIRLGELILNSKNGNYHKFHTFGDPALRLPFPRHSDNIFNPPNEIPLVEERNMTVDGAFSNSTFLIRGNDKYITYNYDESDSLIYTMPGPTYTKVDFKSSTCYRIPMDAGACDNCAVIQVYQDEDGWNGKIQTSQDISIINSGTTFQDEEGPEIIIFQENNPISTGSALLINSNLTVSLIDTSGINLMETIGHGIRYAYDNDNLSLLPRSEFIYEGCDSGSVSIPVPPTLSEGLHRFYLEAWDGVNNKSTVDIQVCIDEIANDYDCEENGMSNEVSIIPNNYNISSIYPNPFNPSTTISFSIPEFGLTTITAYDITGRQIETLTNEVLSVGYYSINWNASSYPSGVYLIRMDSGEFTQTQKVVLVK